MDCPPEFAKLWAARATISSPLYTDVRQMEDLVKLGRDAVEDRERIAETGQPVPAWGIIGIYRTHEAATRALDWVKAWRAGS